MQQSCQPSLSPLQITFEISKEEESHVPLWIILGSTLGGLLLLALLVLALWKVRPPHPTTMTQQGQQLQPGRVGVLSQP